MSLCDYIKRMSKSQYFRKLVVRAVEDACILLVLTIGIWIVCALAGWALALLGVG